ncbi:hypothetical protein [Hyphomonas sp.]|uniref:hypothetical protein n=1 Tax=Hyphomonas sp. TaxID=87 RepID=UPI003265DBFC
MNSHLDMLARCRMAEPAQAVPGVRELSAHLQERLAVVGDVAYAEFAYLQKVAAETWGAARTSHFVIVLRKARVVPKAAKVSRWKMANAGIDRLPAEWRTALRAIAEHSEKKVLSSGPIWSADYLGAVTTALCRYVDYARCHSAALVPAGSDLHQYALWLTDPGNKGNGVSIRAAADYLSRIKAGLAIILPTAISPARNFVVRYWREKAVAGGTPTKSGDQLVGAVAIYDLGFRKMAKARDLPMRGIEAATLFRNGLVLSMGIALPQRARAISALTFGTTVWVEQPDRLHVRIPAAQLKMREARKSGDPFDIHWHNPRLVAALEEYRLHFRPLFDDGTCLFPSVQAPGQSLGEKRLGQLTSEITEKELGVRIPIHRFRDNVATDSAEHLTGGRLTTAALLDHMDIGTGDHYDRSTGAKAAAEYGGFLDERRTAPAELTL